MNELNENLQQPQDGFIIGGVENIPEVQEQVTPLQLAYNTYREQMDTLKKVNRDIRSLKIEINNATRPGSEVKEHNR